MSVIHAVHEDRFTVVSNALLQDRRLSLKARGLLVYCCSLPEDWKYSVEGLAKVVGEGRESIGRALRELEACGYLKRRRLHDAKGKFVETEYVIFETAQPEGALPVQNVDNSVDNSMDKAVDKGEKTSQAMPSAQSPAAAIPAAENPAAADLFGIAPEAGKPAAANRLQENKEIRNKDQHNPTTKPEEAAEEALSEGLCALAGACRVSERALRKAAQGFGTAMVSRYLTSMQRQSNIRNPDAWLARALRERWETGASESAPRPDCPECGGMGYVRRGYKDPLSGKLCSIQVKCVKCRGF